MLPRSPVSTAALPVGLCGASTGCADACLRAQAPADHLPPLHGLPAVHGHQRGASRRLPAQCSLPAAALHCRQSTCAAPDPADPALLVQIIFYAPVLFSSLGRGATVALENTCIIGAVNVLSTLVAVFLVDRLGRKVLLIQGGIQVRCPAAAGRCSVSPRASIRLGPGASGSSTGGVQRTVPSGAAPLAGPCLSCRPPLQMIAAEIIVGVVLGVEFNKCAPPRTAASGLACLPPCLPAANRQLGPGLSTAAPSHPEPWPRRYGVNLPTNIDIATLVMICEPALHMLLRPGPHTPARTLTATCRRHLHRRLCLVLGPHRLAVPHRDPAPGDARCRRLPEHRLQHGAQPRCPWPLPCAACIRAARVPLRLRRSQHARRPADERRLPRRSSPLSSASAS